MMGVMVPSYHIISYHIISYPDSIVSIVRYSTVQYMYSTAPLYIYGNYCPGALGGNDSNCNWWHRTMQGHWQTQLIFTANNIDTDSTACQHGTISVTLAHK